MGKRTKYPIPRCPKCNAQDSITARTYYTRDNQIVRHRTCNICNWRFYTSQPVEQLIDPSTTIVQFPTKIRHLDKRVNLIPVDLTTPNRQR
jgi:transcriptional regulator NrdR family protein